MNKSKTFLNYNFKKLSRLNIVNKRNKIFATFLCLGIGVTFYDDLKMFLIGEGFRKKQCTKLLKERFEFSGKYLTNSTSTSKICTISPTNINDVQKLMEISNYYQVPIIYDKSYLPENIFNTNFIHLDYSKFNKIINFDYNNKLVTLEPGVKIFQLLTLLENLNLTIPDLEKYKLSNLTIGDIFFNNFYSFNEGKFIDDMVKEILVCIPNGNKILNIKQNDDLTLTGLNLKNLFLRNNYTLGLILQIKMKLKLNRKYKYIKIKNVENSIQENLFIIESFNELKKDFGISDLIIISKEKETDLFLKIKNKNITKCLEILKSTSIQHENIGENAYLKSTLLSDDGNKQIPNELRKLKIYLHKKDIFNFLLKTEKLAKENLIQPIYRCSYMKNEVEMLVKTTEDIYNIERGFKFLSKISDIVLKLEGNIFVNNNIKVNSKYHLMKDIGVENYLINENIKYLFDPNYILNPHLSIKKPESTFKAIKRNNKIWNYLLTKLEI